MAILFAVIAVFVVVLLVVNTYLHGYEECSDYWQEAYYSFAILGAAGTMLAVIVALKKESLKRLLYSPDFKVELASTYVKPHYSPNNTGTIEKYSMSLLLKNDGTTSAKNCKVEILSVQYNKNRTGKKFNQLALQLGSAKAIELQNDMLPRDTQTEMLLFEVLNPTAIAKPQSSNSANKKDAQIDFCGFMLDYSDSLRGKYKLLLRLSCNENDSFDFNIEVDWAGGWTDDIEEIKDKINTIVEK